MLVDEFLPVYAVPASVATVVDADIQTTWDAVLRQYSVRRAKQCRYAPQITQTCSLASENGATFQIIQAEPLQHLFGFCGKVSALVGKVCSAQNLIDAPRRPP